MASAFVKSLDCLTSGYRLYGATHEDGGVEVVTTQPLNRRWGGIAQVVEFEKEGDALVVAKLLLEKGVYSSIEVVKSCGFYIRKVVE